MSNIIKSFRVVERSIVNRESLDKKDYPLQAGIEKEATIEYERIISTAREKAKKIIDSALEEYEEKMNLAYEKSKEISNDSRAKGYNKGLISGKDKGFKEGYQVGYEEGKNEAKKLIKEALELKDTYIETRNDLLKKLEQDIISLVMIICKKVFHTKMENDKELIVDLVMGGMSNLKITEKLTIIVSKEDFDVLDLQRDKIQAKASSFAELNIRIDSEMIKGDCILETSKGNVDISIKKQLDEVENLLISVLNNE